MSNDNQSHNSLAFSDNYEMSIESRSVCHAAVSDSRCFPLLKYRPYPYALTTSDIDNIAYVAVIDIETLSKRPNAAIASIGVTIVDVLHQVVNGRAYFRVNHEDQVTRHRSTETIDWWEKQKEKYPRAYMEIYGEELPRIPLDSALEALVMFLEANFQHRHILVMGNGSEFDNVILSDAFNECEMIIPWEYYNNQSLRTVKWLSRIVNDANPLIDLGFIGEKHHALDDSFNEACQLIAEIQLFMDNRAKQKQPLWVRAWQLLK